MAWREQGEGGCTEEEAECVMCGLPDGQRHWMVECGHAAGFQLRRWGKTIMYDMISELGRGRDKEYRLAETILHWAWSRDDACRIWTGLWSPQLMEDL